MPGDAGGGGGAVSGRLTPGETPWAEPVLEEPAKRRVLVGVAEAEGAALEGAEAEGEAEAIAMATSGGEALGVLATLAAREGAGATRLAPRSCWREVKK